MPVIYCLLLLTMEAVDEEQHSGKGQSTEQEPVTSFRRRRKGDGRSLRLEKAAVS